MSRVKFDVLTFGSITLDIFIPLDKEGDIKIVEKKKLQYLEIPLGAKIQAKHSLIQCGGGAANTAVGFSKLGFRSAVFGVLGDQSSKNFLIKELEKHNINTNYIVFAKNRSSSFSIILNSWKGSRTVLHRRTSCEAFNRDILLGAPKTKSIYIGHLYDNDILKSLGEWKAKNPQSIVGWNPGHTQFKKGVEYFSSILPDIDYLFINCEEAESFTGINASIHKREAFTEKKFGEPIIPYTPHESKYIADVRPIAQKLLNLGVKHVIITDGKKGAQIFDQKHHFYLPPQEVGVVDTLGAGDAFSVGVFSARLYGESLRKSIVWGGVNAASVIQKYGAQPGQLKLPEIKTLTSSVE